MSLGQGQEIFVTVRVEESDYFRWRLFVFLMMIMLL